MKGWSGFVFLLISAACGAAVVQQAEEDAEQGVETAEVEGPEQGEPSAQPETQISSPNLGREGKIAESGRNVKGTKVARGKDSTRGPVQTGEGPAKVSGGSSSRSGAPRPAQSRAGGLGPRQRPANAGSRRNAPQPSAKTELRTVKTATPHPAETSVGKEGPGAVLVTGDSGPATSSYPSGTTAPEVAAAAEKGAVVDATNTVTKSVDPATDSAGRARSSTDPTLNLVGTSVSITIPALNPLGTLGPRPGFGRYSAEITGRGLKPAGTLGLSTDVSLFAAQNAGPYTDPPLYPVGLLKPNTHPTPDVTGIVRPNADLVVTSPRISKETADLPPNPIITLQPTADQALTSRESIPTFTVPVLTQSGITSSSQHSSESPSINSVSRASMYPKQTSAVTEVPPISFFPTLGSTGNGPTTAFYPAAGSGPTTAFYPAAGSGPTTALYPAAGSGPTTAFYPAAGSGPTTALYQSQNHSGNEVFTTLNPAATTGFPPTDRNTNRGTWEQQQSGNTNTAATYPQRWRGRNMWRRRRVWGRFRGLRTGRLVANRRLWKNVRGTWNWRYPRWSYLYYG